MPQERSGPGSYQASVRGVVVPVPPSGGADAIAGDVKPGPGGSTDSGPARVSGDGKPTNPVWPGLNGNGTGLKTLAKEVHSRFTLRVLGRCNFVRIAPLKKKLAELAGYDGLFLLGSPRSY